MSNSMEVETLTFVYSLLSGDSELVNSTGIDPNTGQARTIAIYNQVEQNAPVPYVRITVTDTITLQDEPYDYTPPSVRTVSLLVDIFSDYEKECFSIAGRLQTLLENTEITTDHYHGSAWHKGTTFFQENQSNPDKVFRRGSMRLRVNLETP